MWSRAQAAGDNKRKLLDAHRLSEFVYGTITGMVAINGIDPSHSSWAEAAAIIIVGAAAIWIAHAYSILLGQRIGSGRRLAGSDFGYALWGSWPIVTAGVMLALPTLLAAASIWTLTSCASPVCSPRSRHPRVRRHYCRSGDTGDVDATSSPGGAIAGSRPRRARVRTRRASLRSRYARGRRWRGSTGSHPFPAVTRYAAEGAAPASPGSLRAFCGSLRTHASASNANSARNASPARSALSWAVE